MAVASHRLSDCASSPAIRARLRVEEQLISLGEVGAEAFVQPLALLVAKVDRVAQGRQPATLFFRSLYLLLR